MPASAGVLKTSQLFNIGMPISQTDMTTLYLVHPQHLTSQGNSDKELLYMTYFIVSRRTDGVRMCAEAVRART